MRTESIKNYAGKVLAYIDIASDGTQTLTDFRGKVLGVYNPRRNITQNYAGKILAEGNTLGMLIVDPNIKREEVTTERRDQNKQPKPEKKQPHDDGRNHSATEAVLAIVCAPLYIGLKPLFDLAHKNPSMFPANASKTSAGRLLKMILITVVSFIVLFCIAAWLCRVQ